MLPVVLGSFGALLIGYLVYGRFLASRFKLDNTQATPADTMCDGVDYVPTRAAILFGHHFSSIAGAGPIVGPIFAATAFGWLPGLVWIILAVIFIGGMHDFSVLVASIRHRARSIAEIARQYIGPLAYRLLLAFLWLAVIYVIIVFMDLTSATFVAEGSVASSSAMYIFLAICFGIAIYRLKLPILLGSAVFIPLVFMLIWLGQLIPIDPKLLPPILRDDPATTWNAILLLYCLFASIAPVWLLLQPRDYLSSFLLYTCLLGGGIGVLVGASEGDLRLSYPCFTSWWHPKYGGLIPVLFILIACGAVSGFHSLVASGTTAKQLAKESHARPIGYGAMLIEGVLAIIALCCVIIVAKGETILEKQPIQIFASGISRFFSSLGVPSRLGETFGLLAVSAFILTTLDTCTRIGRFLFEEFFGMPKGILSRLSSTVVTLVPPAIFVMTQFKDPEGRPIPAWKMIWPVFGSTNQLIAGLALLTVACWLSSIKRGGVFILIPMFIMLVVTTWSLGGMVLNPAQTLVVRIIAAGLLGLAIILIGLCLKRRPHGVK